MTKQEFLELASSTARESSRTSGLPAGMTVAQAALESSWGNSELSRKANNYFGIKAHGKHASVEMLTTECVPGEPDRGAGTSPAQPLRVSARFASYPSIAECFACRDRLILHGSVYAEARACADDPYVFARALARHWATDPSYAEKLLRIYREHDLSRLDEPSGVVGTPAL